MPDLLTSWRTYTEDFESPDLFIDWGWYSLISAHLQRRVWISGNSDPVTKLPTHNSIFLNQFIVLVGPAASGKTRVTSNVKGFCEHDDNKRTITYGKDATQVMVYPAVCCTPDNITFEGLYQFLDMPKAQDAMMIPYKDEKGNEKMAPYCHNSVTAGIEELGVMFSKNTEDVASFMCQAYDARNMSRHTKTQGSQDIHNVCVNFLAGTTTKALTRLINQQIIAEGFSTRVIFVYAKAPRFYRDDSILTPAKVQAAKDIVKHVNNIVTKVYGEVSFSAEAKAFMKDYYESGKLRESERTNFDVLLDGYYGRKKLHWRKLSCAMHFGCTESINNREVSLETVKSALALLNRTEVSMHLCFRDSGKNENADVAEEVLAYLKQHGETTYKKLYFNFYKNVEKEELDKILQYLEVTELVRRVNGGNYSANTKSPLSTEVSPMMAQVLSKI